MYKYFHEMLPYLPGYVVQSASLVQTTLGVTSTADWHETSTQQ